MIKIKIDYYKSLKFVMMIFLLFPFIQQRTMEELPNFIQISYYYGTILSSTIIYILIFMSKKIKIDSFLFVFIAFWLYGIFNTFLVNNYSDGFFLLKNVYCMTALMMYIYYECRRNANDFIHALSYIYHFFIIANFILFIIFPEGIYEPNLVGYHKGHLLGDDNALIYVLLPGIIITMLDSYIRIGKLKLLNYLEIISCLYTFCKVWSATSIVCYTLFICLVIFDRLIRKINLKQLIVMFVIILFIVFFGLNLSFVQEIIVDGLKKSVTLSGRTILWSQAFEMIGDRLLFGYGGYYKYGQFLLNGIYYPCHTPFIQILIDGGIISLILFVVMILCVFKIAEKIKFIYINLLYIGLFCIMINYLFEYSQLYPMFILMGIIVNSKYIVCKEKNFKSSKIRLLRNV